MMGDIVERQHVALVVFSCVVFDSDKVNNNYNRNNDYNGSNCNVNHNTNNRILNDNKHNGVLDDIHTVHWINNNTHTGNTLSSC